MPVSDDFLCLFTAEIETQNGERVIRIPEREFTIGSLDGDNPYRVAILSPTTEIETDQRPRDSDTQEEPPVTVGDQYEVEIEDMGDQGDGLARIDPGYIIFVPDTTVGDRVTVEITEADENVGFAEVVDTPSMN